MINRIATAVHTHKGECGPRISRLEKDVPTSSERNLQLTHRVNRIHFEV